MKRKELMKRVMALALSAMMTIGNLPAVTYASEIPQIEDGGVIQTEESDIQSESVEVSQSEEAASDESAAVQEEASQSERVDQSAVEPQAEEGNQIAVQDAQENDSETEDADAAAKAAAAEYLQKNYIDNNKVVINGSDAVIKSEDGLTYTIGSKIPNGSEISSIALKREDSSSQYVTGWFLETNDYIKTVDATVRSRDILKRPIGNPFRFKATVKLFAKGTTDDAINGNNGSTATPLATQEFTFILEPAEVEYKLQVNVQDEDKNAITDATVTLEKDGWNTVLKESDGTYKVENAASYKLTVNKDGYVTYTENFTYTGNADEPTMVKTVTLTPITMRNITFSVKDKATGIAVSGATITVKQGYYSTIKPEADGSYKLQGGTSYNWTVEATNYKKATGTISPTEDTTVNVELEKSITSYAVTFKPMDGSTEIINSTVKVEEEVEDEWGDTDWETVSANKDGSYTLKKSVIYRYSVTAEGYKAATNISYKPTGTEESITVPVAMDKDVTVDPADQTAVDAVKALFDKEAALKPSYKIYGNINALIEAKLKTGNYASVDKADQVNVSVVSSDDKDWIGMDGVIHYSTADTLNLNGINCKTVSLTIKFSLNGATATSEDCRVIVGWDQNHFASKMKAEADQLTWDKIKGENEVQTEVSKNLTLPQCMGTSLRQVWSTISWTSSDPGVINIQKPSYTNEAATGIINQPVEDTKVTLTATFTANESVMNNQVETPMDIATIRVPFEVTVKGTGKPAQTEEELKAILEKYYKITDLVYYGTTTPIDAAACTGDIQLLRYTRIEDEAGKSVFENKEITVTSDNNAIKVNGYKAYVDVFQKEDTIVNLTVTFTRERVTVSEVFPITIKKLTQKDLTKEVEMMEYAKAHYFDGIKGNNISADKITENLHPFQEMYFDADGKSVWVYDINDKTDKGICADGYFDDPWQMEGAGYNRFKSSNNAVIQHENLVVIRPESPTEITITSWLSSERYGKYAAMHKDNEDLKKLYKQEVSVTVTVQPESKATEQLQKAIDKLQELLDAVTEGNGAGQYPAGTKDKLQKAIEEAKALLNSENPADADLEAKAAELTSLLDTVQATQNETEAAVTVKMNTEAGKGMDVSKMTVKAYTAEEYGYKKADVNKNKITVLDALVAWHALKYGDAFTKNPTEYLDVNSSGWIYKIFGVKTSDVGFLVNNASTGSATANEACLVSGDSLSVFRYAESANYQDFYLYFEGVPETVKAKTQVAFTLLGMKAAWGGTPVAQSGYTVAAVDEKGNTAATAVTDADGKAVLQINAAGTYQIVVTETPKDSTVPAYILPKDLLTVTALASDGLTIPTIDGKIDLGKLQIKDGDTVLKEGVDYTVDKTVSGNNVTVKITFIGAYTGEVTRTYTVTPQEPPKHTHSFGPWYTVAAATTTSPERQERACACGEKETRTVGEPLKAPEVHEHSYGAWYTVSAATVFAAEVQERVCACGEKETRTVGTALEKTIKVNMTTIPLKVKQTTTKFKVSGLAAGDSVVSYASSNKKIFTVDKNGKLKAGKKKGSAKLTITLKSGLKKTVTVKVQKSKVKTKKIQNLTKTIVLEKGNKATLKPVLNPLTSQQGIRYYSSKKSVARVSSKGVITAKKAGKATITVKSGSKKYRITVKVK